MPRPLSASADVVADLMGMVLLLVRLLKKMA
jgi:hypothetical protein